MPRINHLIEHHYTPTFRSEKVAGMFDVSVSEKLTRRWELNIPLEDKPWSVGLIVGASGSGKTTIAQQLFGDKMHRGFEWTHNCLLDDFPESCDVKQITETLSRVGFSSPPSWLLPYEKLSNGQKFRVELARCLLEYGEELFVFDEFTSFVDRQAAQIGCYAFRKAVKKFVAVTCHYDIEPWLSPDWVLDMSTGEFRWGCLQRPPIEFKIQRVHHSAWKLFKDHHYLTGEINKSAICFCGFIDERPVAFDAWLPFFGRLSHGKAMRGHRTVVLPDFQGLGLGNRLFTELSRMWTGLDYRVFSGTAHPAEVKKRLSSGEWRLTRQGRTARDGGNRMKRATGRLTCGFEFIGAPMSRDEARQLCSK